MRDLLIIDADGHLTEPDDDIRQRMPENTVKTFLARTDISEADKRTILGDNPQRFYGFTAEVAPTPAPAGVSCPA